VIVSLSGSLVRLLGHRHSSANCRSVGGQASEMTSHDLTDVLYQVEC
jgi:hypothetical protein